MNTFSKFNELCNPQDPTSVRLCLFDQGYQPIMVNGKGPKVLGWNQLRVTQEAIRRWAYAHADHCNTGILGSRTPAIDIDVYDKDLSDELYYFTCDFFGLDEDKVLYREGQAPKFAIPFQTDTPFKLSTFHFKYKEQEHGIEFIADAKQLVAYGIHPKTGKPYTWYNGELYNTAREQLPILTLETAKAYRAAVIKFILEHGGIEIHRKVERTAKVHVLNLPGKPPAGYVRRNLAERAVAGLTLDKDLPEYSLVEEARLRSVLAFFDNTKSVDFDQWWDVVIGCARLPASWMPHNYEIARDYSRLSPKHDDKKFEYEWKWASKPYNGDAKTILTVYADARDLGWVEPDFDSHEPPAQLLEFKAPSNTFDFKPYQLRDPALIPPRQWLLGKHYIRGAVTMSLGAPGRFKSTMVILECVGMAAGRDLIHGTELRGGKLRVAYLNGEEPQDELDRRVAAVCQAYGIDQEDIAGNLWVVSTRKQPIHLAEIGRNGRPVTKQAEVDKLKKWCDDCMIDVLAVDPLISFHRVSENDNAAMDLVCKEAFGAIAGETRSVELVHHPRKPAPGEMTSIEDSRGASAVEAAVRSARVFNFMDGETAKRTGMDKDDVLRRRHVRIDHGKSSMGPMSAAQWIVVHTVILANGDEVATVKGWVIPAPLAVLNAEDIKQIRDWSKTGAYRADSRSDKWLGWKVAEGLPHLKIEARSTDPRKNPGDLEKLNNLLKGLVKRGVLATVQAQDEKRKQRTFYSAGNGEIPTDR